MSHISFPKLATQLARGWSPGMTCVRLSQRRGGSCETLQTKTSGTCIFRKLQGVQLHSSSAHPPPLLVASLPLFTLPPPSQTEPHTVQALPGGEGPACWPGLWLGGDTGNLCSSRSSCGRCAGGLPPGLSSRHLPSLHKGSKEQQRTPTAPLSGRGCAGIAACDLGLGAGAILCVESAPHSLNPFC